MNKDVKSERRPAFKISRWGEDEDSNSNLFKKEVILSPPQPWIDKRKSQFS